MSKTENTVRERIFSKLIIRLQKTKQPIYGSMDYDKKQNAIILTVPKGDIEIGGELLNSLLPKER